MVLPPLGKGPAAPGHAPPSRTRWRRASRSSLASPADRRGCVVGVLGHPADRLVRAESGLRVRRAPRETPPKQAVWAGPGSLGMSYSARTAVWVGESVAWTAALAHGSLRQRQFSVEATHALRLSRKQVLQARLPGSSCPTCAPLGLGGRPLDLERRVGQLLWAAAPRSAMQGRLCAGGPSRRPRRSMSSIVLVCLWKVAAHRGLFGSLECVVWACCPKKV